MKIPSEVISLFNNQSLIAFATSDENYSPNIVPIYWKTIDENGTILLIDNFMKATKKNILNNEKVCVSFWDAETEEAYKLKGIAKYHKDGSIFEQGKSYIQSKNPDKNPRGVVEIKVMEIFTITPGPDAGKKISQ